MTLPLLPRLCTRLRPHPLNDPSWTLWLPPIATATSQRTLSTSSAQHSNPSSSSFFSGPALPSSLFTMQEMKQARQWIARFSSAPLSAFPKDSLQITFSRSSGPGGQNVNKLSTKAHLRLCLSPPPHWLPLYLLPTLYSSPHYVASSPCGLLLSSSNTRSQAQNVEQGIARMKDVILEAAAVGLKGETSEVQKEKVRSLAAREKSKMVQLKKQRKDVKGGRRAGKGAGGFE